jgi:hypothetical protein
VYSFLVAVAPVNPCPSEVAGVVDLHAGQVALGLTVCVFITLLKPAMEEVHPSWNAASHSVSHTEKVGELEGLAGSPPLIRSQVDPAIASLVMMEGRNPWI